MTSTNSKYLYKSTLNSSRAANARKAAFKAVERSFQDHVEVIEDKFGPQDWKLVL
jgi:hypothetical protein